MVVQVADSELSQTSILNRCHALRNVSDNLHEVACQCFQLTSFLKYLLPVRFAQLNTVTLAGQVRSLCLHLERHAALLLLFGFSPPWFSVFKRISGGIFDSNVDPNLARAVIAFSLFLAILPDDYALEKLNLNYNVSSSILISASLTRK